MKNTPNLGIPYPEPADPPRGADQMQGIAQRLDNALGGSMWGQSPDGVRNPGSGAITVPINPTEGVGPAQGFTRNSDGTWTCKLPGVYLVGAFAYLYQVGAQPNLVFSLAVTQNGDEPLAQFNLEQYRIPFVTGPLALAEGDVIGVRCDSAFASGPFMVWASLWATAMPLAEVPPTAPARSYDLRRAGSK